MVPRVTEERKKANYERILEAAGALFASKGYHGTSMNDIVEKSGLSKGAIYGHFESKEQLFLTLQERQLAIDLDQIKLLFSPDDSATEKLKKVLDLVIESTCECPREVCGIIVEFYVAASRIKSLQPRLENYYSTVHGFLTEIIDEGITKGEFNPNIDTETMASIFLAVTNGLQFFWATTGRAFDWQKIKENLITTILEGIIVRERR